VNINLYDSEEKREEERRSDKREERGYKRIDNR
jgi:hypothetical protein